MSATLTKDADRLLVSLYRMYLEARKAGESRADSKHIGGSEVIQAKLMPHEARDDVDELCRELSRADYLSCVFADDTIYDSYLTDAAIIVLENRFKDGLLSVLDFLSKFLPW